MSTRTSIHGHPIHAMLVALPIGLFVFSFFCDLMHWWTAAPVWDVVAFYTLGGAIVTALLAAIPGFIDYTGLAAEDARSVARRHMVLNLIAVALGIVSFWLRWGAEVAPASAVVVSLLVLLVLSVSGWLGGTMVHVMGVSQPQAVENEGRGPAAARAAGARASTMPADAAMHPAMRGDTRAADAPREPREGPAGRAAPAGRPDRGGSERNRP